MDNRVLLVTAEMGLGHIRALKPLAMYMKKDILVLGQNINTKKKVKRFWAFTLRVYNWFSRVSQLPVIGKPLFWFLDSFLYIRPITNNPDQSNPSFPLRLLENALKLGICNELDFEETSNSVVITSFYAPVIHMAKQSPHTPVICQICDTDLSRAWVPRNPKTGNIHFIATCKKAAYRLKAFGVDESKINLFGFPLPHELVGGEDQIIALNNYSKRLEKLSVDSTTKTQTPLRIVYAIGGSGAMAGNGMKTALGLKTLICEGEIDFTIIPSQNSTTLKNLLSFKLKHFGQTPGFDIITSSSIHGYYSEFNRLMAKTHILWTKPIELTFYAMLGIPIIMCPPLGAQERANRDWLIINNIGIDQLNPMNSHIWLANLLNSGKLAQMVKNGWACGRRTALYEIEKLANKLSS